MRTCFQSRISGPWSHVSERRSASGSVWIFAASAGAACSGLWPSGWLRNRRAVAPMPRLLADGATARLTPTKN